MAERAERCEVGPLAHAQAEVRDVSVPQCGREEPGGTRRRDQRFPVRRDPRRQVGGREQPVPPDPDPVQERDDRRACAERPTPRRPARTPWEPQNFGTSPDPSWGRGPPAPFERSPPAATREPGRGELHVRALQHLLDPLTVGGHLPPELLARPRQLAQRLNRRGRDEAAAHQPMGEQIGEPLRVAHVALASREIAHRRRVRQHQRQAVLEPVPHRFPVDARRLHDGMGAAGGPQPLLQAPAARRRSSRTCAPRAARAPPSSPAHTPPRSACARRAPRTGHG